MLLLFQIPTTVFTPMEYGAIGYSEEAAVAKFGKAAIKVYASRYGVLEGASVYKEHIPKARSSLFIGKNLWARNFALANGGSFEGECAAAAAPAPTQPAAILDVHGDPLHNAAQWARREAQTRLRGSIDKMARARRARPLLFSGAGAHRSLLSALCLRVWVLRR